MFIVADKESFVPPFSPIGLWLKGKVASSVFGRPGGVCPRGGSDRME
ncbi:MAG: hypothetical protein RDU59_02670 [Thermodesulfobacteriota bacterium]|nr:hypothetical protein [Thermodesulfobacteriota bacterium]